MIVIFELCEFYEHIKVHHRCSNNLWNNEIDK